MNKQLNERMRDLGRGSNLFSFLFICFWLPWALAVTHGLSLVVVSRGYSLLWCSGFLLRWLLLLWSTGFRHVGFCSSTQGLQGVVGPPTVAERRCREELY